MNCLPLAASPEPKAFLYAFDLLELNGTDLRREPIDVRKATLASILRKSRHGVRLNEHPDGEVVFRHACKMGLEGIAGPEATFVSATTPCTARRGCTTPPMIARSSPSWRWGYAGQRKRGVVHFRQYCIGSCDRECPRDANTGHQRC